MSNDVKINSWLVPFTWLYGICIQIRNQLFNWGILPSEQYSVPIICVGNLAVGGTGKTPHTEYLIRLLKKQYRIAVLSRGYKRKTSGFILADAQSTSRDIGDEPYQMKSKFPEILVAVDSNRRRGIRNLLSLPQDIQPEVILLDDAFQHRYVTPSLSIILTDYHRLFYYDKLMPAGRLREQINGIQRADIVVVTKCEKEMKPIEFRIIEKNMKLQANQQLFFTGISYGEIEPVFPDLARPLTHNEIKKEDDILLISGIAFPVHFIHEAQKYSNKTYITTFPDHHIFNKSDIKKLDAVYEQMESPDKLILVTEKDAARLKSTPFIPEGWKRSLYYLPIAIEFYTENNFDELIKRHIINVQKTALYANTK